MNKLSLVFVSSLLFGVAEAGAQSAGVPLPKKMTAEAPSPHVHIEPAREASPGSGLPKTTRTLQKKQDGSRFTIPEEHQIHSPVRHYALENAENPDYWKHVDTTRIWVEFETNSTPGDPAVAAFLQKHGLTEVADESMHPEITRFYVYRRPGTTAADIIAMAEEARNTPGILFLEPSVIYKGSFVPNDPLWDAQWGPFAVFAHEAWDYGTQGVNSMSILAVVDDAIDWLHEDLFDQVWYGYDYGFNDEDPTPDAPEMTHGTHVTGIMSASTDNGIGMAGICSDTVYFAKVTNNSYFTNNGSYSDAGIINAMYDLGLTERIFAINLSLGGGAPSSAAEMAYNFAWNNGKLPIVASGNESSGQVSYPAAYPACMAVGAIGTDGAVLYLTDYSNYGNQQEVTAPGGDMDTGFGIVSTMPGNLYEAQEGTSMACPHVAGLAGLMKSLNQSLTNEDVRNIINETCLDLGTPGWDSFYGYGMVNAKAALDIAVGVVSADESEAPQLLNLYPNPATDILWVQRESRGAEAVLRIFDSRGRFVKSHRAVRNIFSIDLGDLPGGVYIVHLNEDAQHSTARFVKTY